MVIIKEHLGDGVYLSWDGMQFSLTTDDVACEIYLANEVTALVRVVNKIRREVAQ